MAAHACLKNEFTEDEKYHNRMTWLIGFIACLPGQFQDIHSPDKVSGPDIGAGTLKVGIPL